MHPGSPPNILRPPPPTLRDRCRAGSSKLSKCFSKRTLYSPLMDAFHALAEPHRRKVVEMLAHRGKLSASEICDEFDVTPQAVSQHLRVLREAHVIQMEKRAQRRLYSFNPKSMNPVQAWVCLLYTSPSPRDPKTSRMPSSA